MSWTMDERTQFSGEFKPPGIGATNVPFPIAGPGSCTLRDDGLHMRGLAPSRGSALLAIVGGIAAIGGALIVKFLFFPGMSASTLGAVGAAGLISGALAPRKGRADKQIEHLIPWDRIVKIKADPNQADTAMVIVKRHKPKGAIHFAPADRDDFMAQVANRAGKPIS